MQSKLLGGFTVSLLLLKFIDEQNHVFDSNVVPVKVQIFKLKLNPIDRQLQYNGK